MKTDAYQVNILRVFVNLTTLVQYNSSNLTFIIILPC